ncbi:MAG TPA: SPFH domain-containing protein, partial [bacterium]
MINYISGLVFTLLLIVGGAVIIPMGMASPGFAILVGIVWLVLTIIISSGVQLAAQWEKGVVFRLGQFSGVKGPGLFFIIPLVDQVKLIDTRIRAMDIPPQQMITKDNVPVKINGV